MNSADNVYYRQAQAAPQAYVPYRPANPQPYGRPAPAAAADDGMLVLAIVGLCVTVMLGVPVGLFTGPMALKRARRIEHLVNVGHRPLSDRSNVTGTRISAWISIAWSVPLLLAWLGMFLLIAMAFGG